MVNIKYLIALFQEDNPLTFKQNMAVIKSCFNEKEDFIKFIIFFWKQIIRMRLVLPINFIAIVWANNLLSNFDKLFCVLKK